MPKFCLCVFFGSSLMGEKKHINKVPPKIPGQSCENFVYVFFFFMCFFRSLVMITVTVIIFLGINTVIYLAQMVTRKIRITF